MRKTTKRGALILTFFVVILVSAWAYWKFIVLPDQSVHAVEEFLETFRTTSSPEALLGSYGQKRTEVNPHRFDRLGNPVWRGVGFIELTRMEVLQSDSLNVGGELNAFQDLIHVLSRTKLGARDEYHLAIRQIDDLSLLVDAVSDSMAANRRLAEMLANPDVRLVIGVAEISEATSSDSVDTEAGGGVRMPDDDTLRVDVQIMRTNTRLIRNNTVVAYELGRLCWRENALVLIQKDINGLSDDCPRGMHGRPGFKADR